MYGRGAFACGDNYSTLVSVDFLSSGSKLMSAVLCSINATTGSHSVVASVERVAARLLDRVGLVRRVVKVKTLRQSRIMFIRGIEAIS